MSSEIRKVLVIAYYFPPMGLSGVQRTAKFVKYTQHADQSRPHPVPFECPTTAEAPLANSCTNLHWKCRRDPRPPFAELKSTASPRTDTLTIESRSQ